MTSLEQTGSIIFKMSLVSNTFDNLIYRLIVCHFVFTSYILNPVIVSLYKYPQLNIWDTILMKQLSTEFEIKAAD